MQKLGWCLVMACVVAGACTAEPGGGTSPVASGGSSAGSSGSGGVAGSGVPHLGIGGLPDEPLPTGVGGSPDLGSVPTPVVSCHGDLAGSGGDSAEQAAGGAGQSKVAPPAGGAPFDDSCSPPPSVCLEDGLTLVYFDAGECQSAYCVWEKKSIRCNNSCQVTGCQDSITTK